MKRSLSPRFVVLALLVLVPSLAAAQALLHQPAQGAAPPPPSPTRVQAELAKLDSAPQVERIAAKFQADGDVPNLQHAAQRLVELRPHNGNYRYTLAAAHALQDHKREAYDALVRLQSAGYAFDIANDERFKKVHGTELWDYLVQNMEANAQEFGEGKVAYTLPAGDLLIESLGWDPVRKQLLAGSAREGKVFRVGKSGALEEYIAADAKNGLWAVMDIAVDAPRDAIYVASTAIAHFKHAKKTDFGRAGVFHFKLSTGEFVARHEVPIDGRSHILSSIAVTPKGVVFVADGVLRELWKIEAGKLRHVMHNPKLTTIRGMAASDKALYFADYDLGILGIDLASGAAFDVAATDKVTLYSIEGLSYYDGHLVAIQAGFPPKRVMRFELTPDGRAIKAHQALEAGRKQFGTPTRGVVAGDTYYFIANTQKDRYDMHGLLHTGAVLEPTKVFASDLRFGMGLPGALVPVPKKD
ncbi:MAG TPA: hypothetical protein VND91_01165 [Candidatus Saccharimonadia bacterium]|nr:hypothetical protein [Candidatus Saccharimonadia bacterium]